MITEVEVGKGIYAIGKEAFCDCTNLKKIKLSSDVKYINSMAFQNCSLVSSLEMDGIVEISYRAFYGCTSLDRIVIPMSCQKIGHDAFEGCFLKEIFYTSSEKQWKTINIDYMLNSFGSNGRIHAAKKYFYSEDKPTEKGNYWHYVNGEIVIWDNVEE